MTDEKRGMPVDAFGGSTIDPTKNVLDLVHAAHRRQDDLRVALDERLTGQIHALQEWFAKLTDANDRRYEQQFEAADRAVIKAETSAEKRFEGVNEFRAQLGDQQRTLMPRSEVDVIVAGLEGKINALERQFNHQRSESAGVKGGWGYAVGVVGFVLLVVSIIGWSLRIGGAATPTQPQVIYVPAAPGTLLPQPSPPGGAP